MIQLYGHDLSGNSYKVRLFLSLLNLEFEWIKVDLITAEHSGVEHLLRNPVKCQCYGWRCHLPDAQAILVSGASVWW